MAEVPDLERLTAAVKSTARSDDSLDLLAAAARTRDQLDELGEALLDHFVDQARHAGCSWSQIGGTLGVSKQAAQQRHTTIESTARRLLAWLPRLRGATGARLGNLFSRFTGRARAAVVHAENEARLLGHHYVGTEHLLLGLLREREGVAAKALHSLGIGHDAVRRQVEEIIGPTESGDRTESAPAGHIPFTPRTKKALELGLREALDLGHNYIGSEHILLGLTRVEKGVGNEILLNLGANPGRVRAAVLDLLGSD
jgi:Clp amino terminal domain, pathogenicity island component